MRQSHIRKKTDTPSYQPKTQLAQLFSSIAG